MAKASQRVDVPIPLSKMGVNDFPNPKKEVPCAGQCQPMR